MVLSVLGDMGMGMRVRVRQRGRGRGEGVTVLITQSCAYMMGSVGTDIMAKKGCGV